MKLRLIIAGGRDFNDYELLERECIAFIAQLNGVMYIPKREDIECISGGQRGADKLGEIFAITNGYKRAQFVADWDKFNRSAGPIRNTDMAKYAAAPEFISEGNLCGLIAFWDGESPGTADMIGKADKYSIKKKIIIY